MKRIAVDAMGGDRAPEEIVRGSVAAAKRGIDVVLVGEEGRIGPLLERLGTDLPVVHATEVIEMGEDPAGAIRRKKDASISVAARLVASGEAAGMVSAGSTGAAMAAAAFLIGRLPGVARPAVASLFPPGTVVIDAGANLDCRADHLLQFAVMGTAFAQVHRGEEHPRVGLLNIGEEPGKGRNLERDAFPLLAAADGVHFVGNVEGRDIGGDRVDVIVTDGFTGNVLLKTAEGAARTVLRLILEAVSGEEYQEPLARLMPALAGLRARIDPEAVGGAFLLGVRGVVVIAHGSSSRAAIENAIVMAEEGVRGDLVGRIAAALPGGPGGGP